MSNSEKSNERRELLKKSIVTGTIIGAAPVVWKSPKVSSVILPAHAGTTGPGTGPISCGGPVSTRSITDDDGTDTDIAITYDCLTQTCQITTGQWEQGVGIPANTVAAFDVDDDSDDGATFDAIGTGSNWTPDPGGAFDPTDSDQSPGNYSLNLTSNICMTRISVQFRVDVTSDNSPRTMTISNVAIQEI